MTQQIKNSQATGLQGTHYQPRLDVGRTLGRAVSLHQYLPGLRGFWPVSSIDSSGNLIDLSGQSRTLTLTGTPTFQLDKTLLHLFPMAILNGSTDYFTRADEAGLDILGTESYIGSTANGLTLGIWVKFDDAVGSAEHIIGKWDASGNQRAYRLSRKTTGEITFEMSSNGTASTSVDSTTVTSAGVWYHCVGRFDPSNEIAVFVNGEKNSNTTTIPIAIFNSTAAFRIGANSNGTPSEYMDGQFALPFLSTCFIEDGICKLLYHDTRIMTNTLS